MAKIKEEQLESGIGGGAAAVQFSWNFNTSVSAADPGSKKYSFNNATPASVTEIYVNDTNNDNHDMSTIIAALQVGDKLYIQQEDDSTKFLLATVSTIPTDNTGWFTIPVTIDGSGTLPGNNKGTVFIITYTSVGGATQVVQTSRIQLSQSEVQSLNTTTIDAIAAPGAGKYIKILGCSGFHDHNGTNYVGGSTIALRMPTLGDVWRITDIIDATADKIRDGASYESDLTMNEKVVLQGSADSTGAGGPIQIDVEYAIIDTN